MCTEIHVVLTKCLQCDISLKSPSDSLNCGNILMFPVNDRRIKSFSSVAWVMDTMVAHIVSYLLLLMSLSLELLIHFSKEQLHMVFVFLWYHLSLCSVFCSQNNHYCCLHDGPEEVPSGWTELHPGNWKLWVIQNNLRCIFIYLVCRKDTLYWTSSNLQIKKSTISRKLITVTVFDQYHKNTIKHDM